MLIRFCYGESIHVGKFGRLATITIGEYEVSGTFESETSANVSDPMHRLAVDTEDELRVAKLRRILRPNINAKQSLWTTHLDCECFKGLFYHETL